MEWGGWIVGGIEYFCFVLSLVGFRVINNVFCGFIVVIGYVGDLELVLVLSRILVLILVLIFWYLWRIRAVFWIRSLCFFFRVIKCRMWIE